MAKTIYRKLTIALCVLAMASCSAMAAGPSLLFDPATGEVLSQDRAGEPWYPASITKLMTSYLIFKKLKAGTLKLDQKITVSEIAHEQPPSKIGVPVGKTVSVDFALQALLVYSANDMAYVLAESTETWPDFVKEMNATARTLGMTGTHFMNPNGLFEPRHISTARDIAVLVSALVSEFPEYAHYFKQPNVAVGKKHLANRNSLLRKMPEADGMKTGFVCDSGFNLVATATHDGRRLASVIFGSPSGKARADLAQLLLTDGFTRAPDATRPKLAGVANQATGAIVPADMAPDVCKTKPITLAYAEDMQDWGISFGTYDTAAKADMALRGRLLTSYGLDAGGLAGILEMPNKGGFAAVLANLDQQKGTELCTQYRADKAPCEVLSPQVFQQIATLMPKPKSKAGNTEPGDDDGEAEGGDGKSKPPAKKP
ncbi:D-alanyl-D-alanine carboxypeptidase family protein [Aestuariivirga sp.]|uniref:D-alanyl-D-alanine carboxypeptidase family protein n=1 Tax=Aestuariivirga sp. TaxID=2650926 RepID=UPI0039E6A019